MVAVVEREITERGMRGVNLQPFAYRLKANDKRFYPLYQKCQELGVPVTIHASINFSNNRSIEFGRPLYLCEIACDFPELTIVANHGGWPWVAEAVAVAWKHSTVYIEIGAVAPKGVAARRQRDVLPPRPASSGERVSVRVPRRSVVAPSLGALGSRGWSCAPGFRLSPE